MDKLLKHCTIQIRRIGTYCILEKKGCYRKEIKNRKAYQTIDSSKDIFQAVFSMLDLTQSCLLTDLLSISCESSVDVSAFLWKLFFHSYSSGLSVLGVSVVLLFQIITILWKGILIKTTFFSTAEIYA